MKAFILCAGQASKWDRATEPKHFLGIEGEPLVKRTARQFGDCDPQVVCLERKESAYRALGLKTLAIKFSECTCQSAWVATQAALYERTVILLGDVCYTDALVAQIMACDVSPVIFTDTEDIFALAWNGEDHERVAEALLAAVVAARKRAADPGSCRYAEGGRLWVAHRFLYRSCVIATVSDRTQDFDKWSDYENFKAGGSKNRLFNKREPNDRTPKKPSTKELRSV